MKTVPKTKTRRALVVFWAWAISASPQPLLAAELTDGGDEIVPSRCLVIERCGTSGRSAVHTDAVEAMIVGGSWTAPAKGDTVALPDGTSKTWQAIDADDKGLFSDAALRGGYAYVGIELPASRTMILQALGHSMVYVNGVPRAGDTYSTGWVRTPVALRKGVNHLLFRCGRGQLRLKLVAPSSSAMLNVADATLPDLVIGKAIDTVGAVVVVNSTKSPLDDLWLLASLGKGEATLTRCRSVLPLGVRKVPFRLVGPAEAEAGTREMRLDLMRESGDGLRTLDTKTITLRLRRPEQTRKCTFVSSIDDSVQYYGLNPAQTFDDGAAVALVLTLHGASVEAIGHVDAYSSKSWCHTVAPTNRRPFGFDWEDWGRLDAMEVLDIACRQLSVDSDRVYLTGHSMGGHGVWQMGAIFPDRFAAIGPSAGWISFWSYTGAKLYENATPIEDILLRSAGTSDTLSMIGNYEQLGIYILHGEADDNVPASQAQEMTQHLAKSHKDFVYHEQPRAGHWWNVSDEPGADCVDFAPMMDFFVRHRLPLASEVRQVKFATANPAVSSRCHWCAIETQLKQNAISRVDVLCDPHKRRFTGTTENVRRLTLDPVAAGLRESGDTRAATPEASETPPTPTMTVRLDGQEIEGVEVPRDVRPITFVLTDGKWATSGSRETSLTLKGPHRYGPFKEAFRNHVLFVYGTKGTAEEADWALAKARYDAETFWYRGNGSIEVVADVDYDAKASKDRNVILYGNADTNAAWRTLMGGSPVQVGRDRVTIGDRKIKGGNLACLFIRPKAGSDDALVGAISGTGVSGMRLTDRLPYFVSGVAYPDCIVLSPEVLRSDSDGIVGAGFFGIDWSVEAGDFAWRE